MIKLHVRGGIGWIDWQKDYAEQPIARDKKLQALMWNLLKEGVPVMTYMKAVKYVHLIPQSVIPGIASQLMPLASGLIADSATAGLSHFLERDPVLKPSPLSQLLAGTTYTPRKS